MSRCEHTSEAFEKIRKKKIIWGEGVGSVWGWGGSRWM